MQLSCEMDLVLTAQISHVRPIAVWRILSSALAREMATPLICVDDRQLK